MEDDASGAVLLKKDQTSSYEETDLVEKDHPTFVEEEVLQVKDGHGSPEKTVLAAKEKPTSTEETLKVEEKVLKQYTFCVFQEESHLGVLQSLIDKELSEPYSIYTYRYFVYNWPDLCFFALDGGRYVGVIVCKLESILGEFLQGYIAMLAVDVEYRKRGIGRALSEMAIDAMAMKNAAMIVLETELTNKPALALYQSLGFIRERRLLRYYMNGVDAFRLKLMLHDSRDLPLSED
ncbi:N-alpha-acetyltransferase 30 [Drosophila rhopaloa]|uniref:N-alpha-acetyltransferase 30 n=1 Tax=Drosophila rhopaloa TaxID=1041015 RepID=A0A6P4E3W6_DRORH|nr:N-alpha-acetyltransferase 30 [Drosophila rhopaloa]